MTRKSALPLALVLGLGLLAPGARAEEAAEAAGEPAGEHSTDIGTVMLHHVADGYLLELPGYCGGHPAWIFQIYSASRSCAARHSGMSGRGAGSNTVSGWSACRAARKASPPAQPASAASSRAPAPGSGRTCP